MTMICTWIAPRHFIPRDETFISGWDRDNHAFNGSDYLDFIEDFSYVSLCDVLKNKQIQHVASLLKTLPTVDLYLLLCRIRGGTVPVAEIESVAAMFAFYARFTLAELHPDHPD